METKIIETLNHEQLEKSILLEIVGSTLFNGGLNSLSPEYNLRSLYTLEDLI